MSNITIHHNPDCSTSRNVLALIRNTGVQELRALAQWSEGMVWCSPERRGGMSGILKSQIDWIALAVARVPRR